MVLTLLLAGVVFAGADPAVVSQYEVACLNREALACRTLAGAYAQGTEVAKDEAAARRWGAAGCALGDLHSCNGVGYLEAMGQGGPRDVAAGTAHLQTACDGGIPDACGNVGSLHYEAQAWDRARAAYQKGCAASDPQSCFGLGTTLVEGRGGPRDTAGAVAPLRSACGAGVWGACNLLAMVLANGELPGGPADARELARKACDGGFVPGCTTLGYIIGQGIGGPADAAAALDLMQRSCDKGDARGCDGAGVLYTGAYPGVVMDSAKARADFKKSCEGDYPQGCADYGAFLRALGDPADAQESLDATFRASQLGDEASCALGL